MDKKALLIILIYIISVFSYGQEYSILSLKEAIDNNNIELAEHILYNEIDTLNQTNNYLLEKARLDFIKGHDNVLYYKRLLEIKSKEIDNDLLFRINDELIYTYSFQIENAIPPKRLINENCEIAQKTGDAKKIISCDYYLLSDFLKNKKFDAAKSTLKHSINISNENNLIEIKYNLFENLAIVYQQEQKLDSSLIYYDKIQRYFENKKDTNELINLYYNIGRLYMIRKEYDQSIKYIKRSLSISYKDLVNANVPFKTKYLAEVYYLNKNYQLSADTYLTYNRMVDSINRLENRRAVEELEAKHQTTKKEKENLQLIADKEEQRAQIYALTGGAIILLLAGLFFYNNQRKKKLIAQKEKEIEKGRADSILKNQELATIDAMITGQEKERKKLADELHDDLGSTLTTVRLYFENLKNQSQEDNSKEVFYRTEKLLDEAYEKIRNMSHTRNSGILASKGLIPTLESLAQKITDSGKINVEIIHHGLDQSLENSLELTIFRILQELMSNIIKHAQASIAVVSLTAYEDSINIMVEDNGLGFNPSNNNKNGIGLNNIEKRIESLEGTIEIDSQLNHGTTINLDIPLK